MNLFFVVVFNKKYIILLQMEASLRHLDPMCAVILYMTAEDFLNISQIVDKLRELFDILDIIINNILQIISKHPGYLTKNIHKLINKDLIKLYDIKKKIIDINTITYQLFEVLKDTAIAELSPIAVSDGVFLFEKTDDFEDILYYITQILISHIDMKYDLSLNCPDILVEHSKKIINHISKILKKIINVINVIFTRTTDNKYLLIFEENINKLYIVLKYINNFQLNKIPKKFIIPLIADTLCSITEY